MARTAYSQVMREVEGNAHVFLLDLSFLLWGEVILDVEELTDLLWGLSLDHVGTEGGERWEGKGGRMVALESVSVLTSRSWICNLIVQNSKYMAVLFLSLLEKLQRDQLGHPSAGFSLSLSCSLSNKSAIEH